MGAAAKNLSESDKRRFKIFVVEDSDIYRELLTRFIQTIDRDYLFQESENYDITSFRSGEECISNLLENPDIVVLDYFLNGYTNDISAMDGMETLKQIKMLSPRTHVIVITSQGNHHVASEFIKNGASDYISKEPGVRERLQQSVAKIMRIMKEDESET